MNWLRFCRTQQNHFTTLFWRITPGEMLQYELTRCTRALLSEFQLPPRSWPTLVLLVQIALNNTPLPRLGNRCAFTVFAGLPMTSWLRALMLKKDEVNCFLTIYDVRLWQELHLDKLTSSLDHMHREVSQTPEQRRKSAVSSHNRKMNEKAINFGEVDYDHRRVLQR